MQSKHGSAEHGDISSTGSSVQTENRSGDFKNVESLKWRLQSVLLLTKTIKKFTEINYKYWKKNLIINYVSIKNTKKKLKDFTKTKILK